MFPVKHLKSVLAFAIIALTTTPALALDTFMVGPRAMGMGGANVASVDNNTAQYYNPAAFGFFGKQDASGKKLATDNNNLGRKSWGLELGAAGGYRLTNEFGTYLDELAALDYTGLDTTGVTNDTELQQLVTLVGSLAGLDDEGNAVTSSANGGINLRIGSIGIGAHSFVQAAAQVLTIDSANLGVTFTSTGLGDDIDNATPPAGYVNDGAYTYFTNTDATTLIAALQAADPFLSFADAQDAVDRIDYVATQEGLDPTLASDIVTLIDDVATAGAGNTLSNNTTTVALNGFGHMEVPITYGFSFGDNIAAGVNFKLMKGRVYGTQILVFDEDSGGVMNDAEDDFNETTTFGVDLGIMARFPMINVGLVGRNLNKPRFDGFTAPATLLSNGAPIPAVTYDDVTLDPQATVGIAFMPFETLTLEVDYDLTENDTVLKRPGYTYQTQNLSLGLEWDAFRFLALRVGAYQNTAEDEAEWNLTGGIGLNLWALRLDVGGVYSTEEVIYDGEEAPKEFQVAGMLSMDF